MVFIGWILFVFCGGIGFVSLPFDNIFGYIRRPQPIEEEEFQTVKKNLLKYTMKLRDMGKELEDDRITVAHIKGCSGYRKRRAFKARLRIFETRSILAEREYERL